MLCLDRLTLGSVHLKCLQIFEIHWWLSTINIAKPYSYVFNLISLSDLVTA